METNRRDLLKGLAAAAVATAVPVCATARERHAPLPGAVGLLYDSTKCIGCKTCVVACKQEKGLPPETSEYGEGLYDAPVRLDEHTRNIIQLYREGNEFAYVKKQCMHCVDPACVNACMLGALHKDEEKGFVWWQDDRCIGCRYCEVACPFNVPKFQWSSLAPKIVKCELCRERLADGKKPACVEVCPREAVTFGKRSDLLEEAHRRIRENPALYVNRVFGEHELGGTQVLYLSHVGFDKLGFRYEDSEPVPNVQQTIQQSLYAGFVGPVALLAGLGVLIFRNQRKEEAADPNENRE
jgi:Fe-S-cluster-containing dehydrogenase component